MTVIDKIKELLSFKSRTRFELLETENGNPTDNKITPKHTNPIPDEKDKITFSLEENIKRLETAFRADISKSFVVRRFTLGGKINAAVVFMNGMSNSELINRFILTPGMNKPCPDTNNLCEYAIENIFAINDANSDNRFSSIKSDIMKGKSVVFIEGESAACVFDTAKMPQRTVSKPENEKGVYGSKEAFIEDIKVNQALIRKLVKTDDLVFEARAIGEDAKNEIAICYRDGVANESLINEIKRRIAKIDINYVLTNGTIEQLIEDSSLSPIPQTLRTERPDRCAAYILNGHVAILCDGTPIAIVLPVTLFALMSTAEDDNARKTTGTLMRVVRYAGALISIITPGIFIAVVMHHSGVLSLEVLNTLIASRRMVFVPIGAEMIILMLIFQLVREAGIRVPGTIGQAIGIIGGLVLGQAAISANLASPVVLIIVALTGLGGFCIPDYSTQLSAAFFRMIFLIVGWAGGLLGEAVAFLIFIGYLCTMKSFGVPFLSPFAPKTYSKRRAIIRSDINNGDLRKTDYME